MNESEKLSHELQDIKQIMERSSRFISLSGLSGISAGVCALVGAWFANKAIQEQRYLISELQQSSLHINAVIAGNILQNRLLQIAIITFIAAFLTAFFFTYQRSKKSNVPVWGTTAKRLMINVCIPMVVGGIFLYAMMQTGIYDFVASGCLIFYGLGVVNASKYTLHETRYLGYAEILLGLLSAFFIGSGIYFWAAGFGVLHIVYGIFMWMKYERS
jgi:hypothetical protein